MKNRRFWGIANTMEICSLSYVHPQLDQNGFPLMDSALVGGGLGLYKCWVSTLFGG
jgi:hypothetical protein